MPDSLFPDYEGWLCLMPDGDGGHLIISKGQKHYGDRLADVAVDDPSFLDWLSQAADGDDLCEAIQQAQDLFEDRTCPVCARPINYCRCVECLGVE